MKTKQIPIIILLATVLLSNLLGQNARVINTDDTTTFVSFPDLFNFDIPEPWPKYDTAVNYFLNEVNGENPDFVLVTGDLVDGHWWDSPQMVEHLGTLYYTSWIRRMKQHGLKYYTAIGDHELGDDSWPDWKRELVPHFEAIYDRHLQMPQNGPPSKKGLAYYVREGDFLLVTVETFEVVNDSMRIVVDGEQLEWFKRVMEENRDAKYKVVQGHVPIWGDIKSRSSSMIMLEEGKNSEFYNVMKAHDVDLYLAGEFHDVTVLESDGIWQIVHGSSWGRKIVNTQDYLVAECAGDQLKLTLKRIYMDAQGEYMWNANKNNGPRETVKINEKTLENGPEVTGTLVITKKDGEKIYSERTGYFE